jgi:hypothetical protein
VTATPTGTTVTSAGATLNTAGVQMVIPAGALDTTTTITIGKSTAGAPPMLPGITAAGDMYAITPHGTQFLAPVTVSLPIPTNRTLAANEQWAIAKADPNGAWVIQGNGIVQSGTISTTVNGLSLFTVVVMPFLQAPVIAQPFDVTGTATLECVPTSLGVCGVPKTTFRYTATLNSGAISSACHNPQLRVRIHAADPLTSSRIEWQNSVTVLGDPSLVPRNISITADFDTSGANRPFAYIDLLCNQSTTSTPAYESFGQYGTAHLVDPAALRATEPFRLQGGFEPRYWPSNFTALSGQNVDIAALFVGGAVTWDRIAFGPINLRTTFGSVPGTPDNATIDWERSDDSGRSWYGVGRTLQQDTEPHPYGWRVGWAYWQASHGFTATLSDNNALFRYQACYTPLVTLAASTACYVSAGARLTVLATALPPAITSSPASVLVRTGQSASFTVTADGVPTPALQWQTRAAIIGGAWADIAGATGNTYVTGALALVDSGRQYRVVATNGGGSTASGIATASVLDFDVAPHIVNGPANLTVVSGSDAAFAVTATGTAPLQYQWLRNGTVINGETSPMLRLPAVSSANAGNYSVVVTNAAGSDTSTAATLTVSAATGGVVLPTIVAQPALLTVALGSSATFAVGVSGTGPFTYQWRFNGVAIPGATSASYTINTVSANDVGPYTVIIGNSAGPQAASNTARLDLSSAIQVPLSAPFFATQPAPVIAVGGQSSTLAVQVTGSPTISYQWYKDNAPIANATSAVLVINSVGTFDVGSYYLIATNSVGSAQSNPVQLTLLGVPLITSQPASTSATVGSTATFSVTATGQNLHYAWLRNGVEIVGATGSSYTTPVLTLADTGMLYSVTVYNGSGIKFSNPATLTVTDVPPSGLGYSGALSFPVGVAITPLAPSVTGTVGSYSVSPALPAGLALNTATGVISGTPTTATAQAVYRVTANGPAGSTFADLAITVTAPTVALTGIKATPKVVPLQWATLALREDGTVWAWGTGSAGVLGVGATDNHFTPVQVKSSDGTGVLDHVVDLSGYGTQAFALLSDGTVVAWGTGQPWLGVNNNFNAVLLPTPVKGIGGTGVLSGVMQVSTGSNVNVAVLDTGEVVTWGHNTKGGLGLGAGVTQSSFPTKVPNVSSVVSVAAGNNYVFAIRNDGTVYGWGHNYLGVLGTTTAQDSVTYDPFLLAMSGVVRIQAAVYNATVLKSDGSVQFQGLVHYDNTNGTTCPTFDQAGVTVTNATSPVTAVAPGSNTRATAIGTVPWTPLVVFDGQAYQTGKLADTGTPPTTVCTNQLVSLNIPGTVAGLSRSDSFFGYAWTTDGRVYGFGANNQGQLGSGNTTAPVGVQLVPGFSLVNTVGTGTVVLSENFDGASIATQLAPGSAAAEPGQGYVGLGATSNTFAANLLRSATGNTVTLTLTNLPAHTSISLEFLLAAIDSLDGSGGLPAGDYFKVTLDGTKLFREAFANATAAQIQTYVAPPGGTLARMVDLGFQGPGGFMTDSAYDMSLEPAFHRIPHSASTATFTFLIEGAGAQSLTDESWGMDNLKVTVY